MADEKNHHGNSREIRLHRHDGSLHPWELLSRSFAVIGVAFCVGAFVEWRRISSEVQKLALELMHLQEVVDGLPPKLMTQKYDRAIRNGELEHDRMREEDKRLQQQIDRLEESEFFGKRKPQLQPYAPN